MSNTEKIDFLMSDKAYRHYPNLETAKRSLSDNLIKALYKANQITPIPDTEIIYRGLNEEQSSKTYGLFLALSENPSNWYTKTEEGTIASNEFIRGNGRCICVGDSNNHDIEEFVTDSNGQYALTVSSNVNILYTKELQYYTNMFDDVDANQFEFLYKVSSRFDLFEVVSTEDSENCIHTIDFTYYSTRPVVEGRELKFANTLLFRDLLTEAGYKPLQLEGLTVIPEDEREFHDWDYIVAYSDYSDFISTLYHNAKAIITEV